MNDSDKKEFAKIFAAMGENFNATVSKEGLRVRFEALKEFPIEEIKHACINLVKNRVYTGMPTTGEIRAAMKADQPKLEDIAQMKVNEVMGQIRAIGSYGQPKWSDPIVSDLLSRRWSWQSLCSMTETELKWWAKEFAEAYRAYANNERGHKHIEAHEEVKQLLAGIG